MSELKLICSFSIFLISYGFLQLVESIITWKFSLIFLKFFSLTKWEYLLLLYFIQNSSKRFIPYSSFKRLTKVILILKIIYFFFSFISFVFRFINERARLNIPRAHLIEWINETLPKSVTSRIGYLREFSVSQNTIGIMWLLKAAAEYFYQVHGHGTGIHIDKLSMTILFNSY